MPESELVRQPRGGAQDHPSVAGRLQHGTATQQPGVSNSGRVRGGNRRGKKLWERSCVEKDKPPFPPPFESPKTGGDSPFPPAPPSRASHPRPTKQSSITPARLTITLTQ